MRGLLNQNIAAFDSDNCFGFPPVPQYTGQVEAVEWVDFDTAVPIITRYQHKQMPILRCKKMQKSSYRIR